MNSTTAVSSDSGMLNGFKAKENPVIQAIGPKKWKRLSKSTQQITEEITRLVAERNEGYPSRTLKHFDCDAYKRFEKNGMDNLCYPDLTQGCSIKYDPFSDCPGIIIYMPSPEHSAVCFFLTSCLTQAVRYGLIFEYDEFVAINPSPRDVPLPDEKCHQPDVIGKNFGSRIPYFVTEVNWRHKPLDKARRQVQGAIEAHAGALRCGVLIYHYVREWCAEVYRYLNRDTRLDDVIIPDCLDPVRERELMEAALSESDKDHLHYLQEDRYYVLHSERGSVCEDIPLAMADLFSDQVQNIARVEELRRPNACFWLTCNKFEVCLRSVD